MSQVSLGPLVRFFEPDALVCRSQFGHLEAHVALLSAPRAVGTAAAAGVAVAVTASSRTDAAEPRIQVLQEILESRDGRGH